MSQMSLPVHLFLGRNRKSYGNTAVVGPTQILSLIMRLLMEIWVDEERGGCLQPVRLLLF